MAETTSNPPTPTAAAPFVVPQQFFGDPKKLLQAVSEPVRWAVLRDLASGQALTVAELAARQGRWPDLMSKHLRVLRDAGVVVVVPAPDGDARKQCQSVPATFRRLDEAGKPMLDFGVCALRFA